MLRISSQNWNKCIIQHWFIVSIWIGKLIYGILSIARRLCRGEIQSWNRNARTGVSFPFVYDTRSTVCFGLADTLFMLADNCCYYGISKHCDSQRSIYVLSLHMNFPRFSCRHIVDNPFCQFACFGYKIVCCMVLAFSRCPNLFPQQYSSSVYPVSLLNSIDSVDCDMTFNICFER